MTGRGQGRCSSPNTTGAGYGAGYDAGYGGRGCGRGFGGGRGMARGMGRGFGQASAPVSGAVNETTLQDRARMLEEELNAIKAQLNDMPGEK